MLLELAGVEVRYGSSRILHGVDLAVDRRPVAVVGRNGAGKSTLCHAIMGLAPIAAGTIQFEGTSIRGLKPFQIAERGVALVPQGRRIFPSLTVDEHLRLVEQRGASGWTRQRVYELFPRLCERRDHGGAALSGGEQQMLAIGRALMCNPRLLVMDEPTEGLAPLLIDEIVRTLRGMVEHGTTALLLIEQNLSVALAVADTIAVMLNGRIERWCSPADLAVDRGLQQSLLGVATTVPR
jgi:branched-chain amino acid transport system ATP-binding protein